MQPVDVIRSGLAEIELRKPVKSIAEIEREARERGLSYGKYLAGYRLEKELEEAAAKRQEELREEKTRMQIRDKSLRKPKGPTTSRRVAQVRDDGTVIAVYSSMLEAHRASGDSEAQISIGAKRYAQAQRGEVQLRKSKRGYNWRYADDGGGA